MKKLLICYVYGLFRPDTGQIFYVGMGRGKRAWDHVRHRKRGRGLKDNIICELLDDRGFAEIPVVIFRDGLSREDAANLEIALIYAIGRHPHGPLVNVLKGGEGFNRDYRIIHRWDLERRRRARMSDPDVIAKLSSAKLGKPGAKRGKKSGPSVRGKAAQQDLQWLTDGIEQTRVNRSLPIPEGWRVGRPLATEQAKANMSAAVRPLLTEEHKQKLSAAAKGKPIPWFHTPEVRARARRNRKGRKWITDGTLARTIIPEDSVPEGWRYGRNTAGRPAWNLGLRR